MSMKLHLFDQDFSDLAALTSKWIGISAANVRRDYYIVLLLARLSKSHYADCCVFKGGTSLSKCYAGSIKRFSEDIDLTFVPPDSFNDNQCDKALKEIESILSFGFTLEKIPGERNRRNKSSWVYFGSGSHEARVKLEIGSRVRPDPYEKRRVKSYIQEYLESHGMPEVCELFGMSSVEMNVLSIERTFIDKVMAIKRHAYSGMLPIKVRHIYDVVMLYDRPDIQAFLKNKQQLKKLLALTKQTDSFYISKRNVPADYDPSGPYSFETWSHALDALVMANYLRLPDSLLFSKSKKLDFEKVLETLTRLNEIFKEVGE